MDMVNVIDKIESLVTTSTRVPTTHRTLVHSGKVMELVDQLRLSVPQDIKAAQEIINRKDNIIQQAQSEARRIRNSAEDEYRVRLEQSEMVKAARHNADELLAEVEHKAERMTDQAHIEAKTRMAEADAYALKAMRTLERELTTLLKTVRNGLELLTIPR